jgi:hypothetical protein
LIPSSARSVGSVTKASLPAGVLRPAQILVACSTPH